VALVVKEDELANPVAVGLFGAATEMLPAANGRDFIEQARAFGAKITP
jgi:hypothetical protein